MSQNPKQPRGITPYDGNFFQMFGERIRLILRLMGDGRVNPLIKLLPLGSVIYAIWPIDIPTPIDDVALLMFANYMFVEMCPPEVVEEHLAALRNSSNPIASWGNPPPEQPPNVSVSGKKDSFREDDIIDGEIVDDKPPHDTPK